MRALRKLSLVVAIALSAFTAVRAQTTWYVTKTGDDINNNGESWGSPYATIAKAITSASSTLHDTILVSNGVYQISALLTVLKPTTIRGFNGREVTIIDGQGTSQGVNLDNVNAVLEDITVSNCYKNTYGGGVYLENGLVRNCLITRCRAARGGGIDMEASPTYGVVSNCIIRGNWVTTANYSWADAGGVYLEGGTLVDCTIEGNTNFNTTTKGGGMTVTSSATKPVTRCTITNNWAAGGGGGVWVAGSVTFRDCHIDLNSTDQEGGGIHATAPFAICGGSVSSNSGEHIFAAGMQVQDVGMTNVSVIGNTLGIGGWGGVGVYVPEGNYTAIIDGCDISFNESPGCEYYGGGGICFRGTNLVLRNSRIVGNAVGTDAAETYGRGGGVHIERAGQSSLIENCTIAGNYARIDGGGISMEGDGADVIRNCVVYSNRIETGANNWYFGNNNRKAFVDYTCTPDAMTGTGDITDPPKFVDPATDNYRLAFGSPCIDKGLNQLWMNSAVDIDGNPRLALPTAHVDMGCYEYRFSGTAIMIR